MIARALLARRFDLLIAGSVLLLAFAFQGSRGIWEPDEGFYTNVTVGMIRTGEWLVPRLNGEPFLDKPPLAYWGMAAGMKLLGENEWGARLFHALMLAIAALSVGSAASRLWDRRTGRIAAFVYATSLGPFLAANILTPDMPLAAASALAFTACLRTLGDGASALRWWAVTGLAAGLGFLAKGPAILAFTAPIALHAVLRRGGVPSRKRWAVGPAFAAGIAAAIGVSWYAYLFRFLPGAFTYVLDNQIIGRLFTATYARNAAGHNVFLYYPPVILVGALPWIFLWPGLFEPLRRLVAGDTAGEKRRAPGRRDGAGGAASRRALRGDGHPDPGRPGAWWRQWADALLCRLAGLGPTALIALTFVVPLAILSAASSRLPLYSLPLFAPLALAEARVLTAWIDRATSPWRYLLPRIAAALLCALLVGGKGAAARLAWPHDTRALARALHTELVNVPGPEEIISVDTKHNALPFYGFHDFLWVTSKKDPYPFFAAPVSFIREIEEARGSPEPHVFLVTRRKERGATRELRRAGLRCEPRPLVKDERLIVCAPGSLRSAGSSEIPRADGVPATGSNPPGSTSGFPTQ